MCDSCLLSFATEKDADCDRYKSLVGILHKDIDCFVEDAHMKSGKKEDEVMIQTTFIRCSCCGEPLKMMSKVASYPAYTEVKFISDNDLDIPDDGGREDNKAFTMPLIPDSEEINDDALKTPNFTRNKFFGIPLSDSAQASPRGKSVLDHKSLGGAYMELDEERSAAAVAANNAMAMITRCKQRRLSKWEALQYQRGMMEEQAEYDQDAFAGSEAPEVDADEDYQEWNSHSLSSLSERSACVSPDEGDQHGVRAFEYGGENVDESHLDFENERCYLMGLLTNLEEKIKTSKDEGFHVVEPNKIKHEFEGKASENKVTLTREVSVIRERLRAIEAERAASKTCYDITEGW
ncbi:hypothetical protein HAX54_014953 [Datura stramonium]|uniref:GTD-binding domain-containing protein n=1 Tax=Datura stramonium TaxID=4076 RepID=A0ABS8TR65_DATST|nr:hypothetical protein [Datura stramonium]